MTDFGIPGVIIIFIFLASTLLPLILLIIFFVYLGGIRNSLRDITYQLEQLNEHLRFRSRMSTTERPLSRSERHEN